MGRLHRLVDGALGEGEAPHLVGSVPRIHAYDEAVHRRWLHPGSPDVVSAAKQPLKLAHQPHPSSNGTVSRPSQCPHWVAVLRRTHVEVGLNNVHEHVLECVGHTPLVRLNKLTAGLKANVYAKLEMLNPGASVKDRIALQIIEQAEARGELSPGGTIVEATSGNTGAGLAMAAAIK
ncbi:MAG: pyridoxal-phosphate dependent enzyme, partial [Myxococcales bacterium]|nr:pyridoxal-phosphate dependent enzyme [Myxococcales bacterium]